MVYENGKYVPSKETYIVGDDNKLHPAKLPAGASSQNGWVVDDSKDAYIELDDVANVFYKVK